LEIDEINEKKSQEENLKIQKFKLLPNKNITSRNEIKDTSPYGGPRIQKLLVKKNNALSMQNIRKISSEKKVINL
tara:strand:+ start:59 stop:283 length:225 start_codon:yes stop_codon:yes gene_type:complete